MARHHISDPRVQAVIGRLADQFVRLGSVDALADALTSARSVRAVGRRPGYKAGLVVPTGGGKTRIALRIALRWLEAGDRDDTVVLWVTHRRRLHLQARRALQQLLRDGEGVPDNAASLFASRIRFIMIGDLAAAIPAAADRLSLIIVDE